MIKLNEFKYCKIKHKFMIGKQIMRGGYGAVYYALNSDKKLKAVKFINLKLAKQQLKRSVQKQAQVLKKCENKFCINMEDASEDPKNQIRYIVMDLCNFLCLQDMIYKKGHYKQIEARIYLKHILCGLIYMHNLGILHRDIKSSNICFKNNRCLLIDFGCCKQFQLQNQKNNFSKQNLLAKTNIGTDFIKSPEMIEKQIYNYRSDYWSIGILYYEMLTGVTPFSTNLNDKETLIQIQKNINKIFSRDYIINRIKQQYKEDPQTMYRCNFQISKQAREFISKFLTIDPEKRISEKELKESEYLRKKLQITKQNMWQACSCFLPLKDQSWEQVVNNIENKTPIRSSSRIDSKIQIQIEQYQQETLQQQQFKLQQKLNQQQIRQIDRKFLEKIKAQRQEIKNLLITDFQIMRIKMLINLREKLKVLQKQYKNIGIEQYITLIMNYCIIKMANLKIIKDTITITNKTENRIENINVHYILKKQLSQLYSQDILHFKNNENRLEIIIQALKKKNNQFEKANLRIKDNETIIFFRNCKEILQYAYTPSEKLDRKCWTNFQSILYQIQKQRNSINKK